MYNNHSLTNENESLTYKKKHLTIIKMKKKNSFFLNFGKFPGKKKCRKLRLCNKVFPSSSREFFIQQPFSSLFPMEDIYDVSLCFLRNSHMNSICQLKYHPFLTRLI